jgi:hypothetical protein
VVGEPVCLSMEGRVTQEVRQDLTDQIMYKLAALLPPAYRGEYATSPPAGDS